MENIITILLKAVGILLGLALSFAGAKLKALAEEKLNTEEQNKLKTHVETLVGAADQTMSEEPGQARKNYVLTQLIELGYDITEEVNALIESAVLKLHNSLK